MPAPRQCSDGLSAVPTQGLLPCGRQPRGVLCPQVLLPTQGLHCVQELLPRATRMRPAASSQRAHCSRAPPPAATPAAPPGARQSGTLHRHTRLMVAHSLLLQTGCQQSGLRARGPRWARWAALRGPARPWVRTPAQRAAARSARGRPAAHSRLRAAVALEAPRGLGRQPAPRSVHARQPCLAAPWCWRFLVGLQGLAAAPRKAGRCCWARQGISFEAAQAALACPCAPVPRSPRHPSRRRRPTRPRPASAARKAAHLLHVQPFGCNFAQHMMAIRTSSDLNLERALKLCTPNELYL